METPSIGSCFTPPMISGTCTPAEEVVVFAPCLELIDVEVNGAGGAGAVLVQSRPVTIGSGAVHVVSRQHLHRTRRTHLGVDGCHHGLEAIKYWRRTGSSCQKKHHAESERSEAQHDSAEYKLVKVFHAVLRCFI